MEHPIVSVTALTILASQHAMLPGLTATSGNQTVGYRDFVPVAAAGASDRRAIAGQRTLLGITGPRGMPPFHPFSEGPKRLVAAGSERRCDGDRAARLIFD
jgi:hypothetical protein